MWKKGENGETYKVVKATDGSELIYDLDKLEMHDLEGNKAYYKNGEHIYEEAGTGKLFRKTKKGKEYIDTTNANQSAFQKVMAKKDELVTTVKKKVSEIKKKLGKEEDSVIVSNNKKTVKEKNKFLGKEKLDSGLSDWKTAVDGEKYKIVKATDGSELKYSLDKLEMVDVEGNKAFYRNGEHVYQEASTGKIFRKTKKGKEYIDTGLEVKQPRKSLLEKIFGKKETETSKWHTDENGELYKVGKAADGTEIKYFLDKTEMFDAEGNIGKYKNGEYIFEDADGNLFRRTKKGKEYINSTNETKVTAKQKVSTKANELLTTTKSKISDIKSKVANNAVKPVFTNVGDFVKNSAQTVKKIPGKIGSGISKIFKTTKKKTLEIKQKIGDSVVVKGTTKAGQFLKEKFISAKNTVKKIPGSIKNKVESVVDSIGKVSKEKYKQLKEKLQGDTKTTDSNVAKFVKQQLHDKEVVDECVQLMVKKYGNLDEGISRLIEYSEKGDYNIFTRDYGVRDKMKSITGISINGYLQELYYKVNNGEIVLSPSTYGRLHYTLSSNITLNMNLLAEANAYYGDLSSTARKLVKDEMYSYQCKVLTSGKGDENFVQQFLNKAYSKNPAAAKELLDFFNTGYGNALFKDMTVNEAIAIFNYTLGSTQLQKYLGTGNFTPNPHSSAQILSKAQADLTIKHLDKALSKGPILKQDQVFYSGIDMHKLKYWGISDEADLYGRVGKTFTVDNYISASPFEKGAFDMETTWKIKASKGSKVGAYINEISAYSDSPIEYEFLFKRNAEVRIDNVYKDPYTGKTVVEATIVDFRKEGRNVK